MVKMTLGNAMPSLRFLDLSSPHKKLHFEALAEKGCALDFKMFKNNKVRCLSPKSPTCIR
jgi:hypothetical protein